MRICSGAGCIRAVPDDVRFCDECKPADSNSNDTRYHTAGNTDRERYQFLYEGSRFQKKIRPQILQRDPICMRCGCAASCIVDHIVPAGEAIRQVHLSGRYPYDKHAGFFVKTNLQGLCRSCHGKKTVEDKAHQGEWPSVMDKEDAAQRPVLRVDGGVTS